MKNINIKIKQPEFEILIIRNNISKGELAKKMDVSPSIISVWSKGKSQPKAPMRIKLMEALSCSFDDIFLVE